MAVWGSLLTLVGFGLFGWLAAVMQPPYRLPMPVRPGDLLPALLLLCALMLGSLLLSGIVLVAHEACHGLAIRFTGARPQYGAKILHRILPVLYATAPRHWMTKAQYVLVILAPTLLVNLAGIALMTPPSMLRYMMVFPLAVHFGGCLGDWWILTIVLRLPAAVRIQDTGEGFRYRV